MLPMTVVCYSRSVASTPGQHDTVMFTLSCSTQSHVTPSQPESWAVLCIQSDLSDRKLTLL